MNTDHGTMECSASNFHIPDGLWPSILFGTYFTCKQIPSNVEILQFNLLYTFIQNQIIYKHNFFSSAIYPDMLVWAHISMNHNRHFFDVFWDKSWWYQIWGNFLYLLYRHTSFWNKFITTVMQPNLQHLKKKRKRSFDITDNTLQKDD
jgi:hypothetical protein